MFQDIAPEQPPAAPKPYEHLRVLGLLADQDACGHYRVLNPLTYLQHFGASCSVTQTLMEDGILDDVNILIVQRQYTQFILDTIKKFQAKGGLAIYEVDDDLHTVMPSSPVYGIYHPGSPACRGVAKVIEACDGITVSTQELAEAYQKYNDNIHVVPNAIDFNIRDWLTPYSDKNPEEIIIGYAGGSTHNEDLDILQDVVPTVLKRYPYVKFAIYTSLELAASTYKKWGLEDHPQCITIPPTGFKDYPYNLGMFDIGLVPVKLNAFNSAKSPLKILEYGARMVPGVASVAPPYARCIDHGVDGFLAKTSVGWIDSISYLIEHPLERAAMAQRIHEKVRSQYNMETAFLHWPRTWEKIKNREKPQVGNTFGMVGRNDPCPCGSGKKYKKCTCYGAFGN